MNNNRSTELNELFKAISLAQAEIKVAEKNAFNPHFKNNYANLQSLIECSRPALCKNQLAVMQQIVHDEGGDYLHTILSHASGQWISASVKLTPTKPDIQSLGAYITYMRRYSYAALIGVYDGWDEDDDGNSNSLVNSDQLKIITSFTHDNVPLLNEILKSYNVKDLRNLKAIDATSLINRLS